MKHLVMFERKMVIGNEIVVVTYHFEYNIKFHRNSHWGEMVIPWFQASHLMIPTVGLVAIRWTTKSKQTVSRVMSLLQLQNVLAFTHAQPHKNWDMEKCTMSAISFVWFKIDVYCLWRIAFDECWISADLHD